MLFILIEERLFTWCTETKDYQSAVSFAEHDSLGLTFFLEGGEMIAARCYSIGDNIIGYDWRDSG